MISQKLGGLFYCSTFLSELFTLGLFSWCLYGLDSIRACQNLASEFLYSALESSVLTRIPYEPRKYAPNWAKLPLICLAYYSLLQSFKMFIIWTPGLFPSSSKKPSLLLSPPSSFDWNPTYCFS